MQPDHSYAKAMRQMRLNCARDLPWFVGKNIGRGKEWIVVAGGPSIRSRLAHIRQRQKRGACVFACNGAAKLLISAGIKPDIIGFLDISDVVTGFIPENDTGSLYMVCSTVHPSVLDALAGRKILLWHCDFGPGRTEDQAAILNDFPDKPGSLIGGGNTIGMRAPHIGFLLGFRSIHFYGIDSSFAEDGSDHAYIKHDGVEPESVTVQYREKSYRCSPWMVKQADEFAFYYRQLTAHGAQIFVHGDGLIPDIWRHIRNEERAAA